MKTTKSIIVVLFVLLAAQVASAFYCPATGRWLSRDPIGEPGFQVLQKAGYATMSPTAPHSPSRWISRDPASEQEAETLNQRLAVGNGADTYSFAHNAPTIFIDKFGLIKWETVVEPGVTSDRYAVPGVLLNVQTDSGGTIDVFRPHDGKSYFCHGFTFDGVGQSKGPYSIDGGYVRQILKEDGWVHVCCGMAAGGIAVFNRAPPVHTLSHSGKIESIAHSGTSFDEARSMLKSKWGWTGDLNVNSFAVNAAQYGRYECWVKKESVKAGCCPKPGPNERPPR